MNREITATFHPKRHPGLERYSLIWARWCWWPITGMRCPADLRGVICASTISSMGTWAALQHVQQKARKQKDLGSPFQLSQRLNMWPSVTWSSYVKIKTEFKTRNTRRTRCSIWAKPFWVNILQRTQIISFQTLGICIYLNVYKILLFLDNRFILQKNRNPADWN